MSITIPESVKKIGDHAFENCSSLIDITSLAVNAPEIADYTFDEYTNETATLTIPAGSKNDYLDTLWSRFMDIKEQQESGIDEIRPAGEDNDLIVKADHGDIIVEGTAAGTVIEVYNLTGTRLRLTTESRISGLPQGLYIVRAGSRSLKISL